MPPQRPSLFTLGSFWRVAFAREQLRAAEGQLAGEPLVELEAHAVVRKRKIAVRRDDKIEIVDQVRRVAQHVAALAQCIENQRQVHLLEIAHAAMYELGAAAGSLLGEIGALDEQRAIAAGGGFNGSAEAGGSAADYENVPRPRIAAELFQNFIAMDHACRFLS